MGNHRAITGGRFKLAGGMLVGAVASGALAVGSLSGAGAANASCVNVSGIALGTPNQCQATFLSVSASLGQGAANAGNPQAFTPLNFAFSVGGASASAGQFNTGAARIGNVSIAAAGGSATTSGFFNLAGAVGANQTTAIGLLNNSLSLLGSGNTALASGFLNHASTFLGNNNTVLSGNTPGTGLRALLPGLNVANSSFGTGIVAAGNFAGGNGPGALALNIFRSNPAPVTRPNLGINLNNVINFP